MDNSREEGFCDDDNSQEESVIRFPISCTNVPESLFDCEDSAAKHFSKFGPIYKIRLQPSKQSCIVEYERRDSAERAILNAGAYDGFMFNVTWNKHRKRPKVNDDPDWIPDADVAAELAAMSGQRLDPRLPRQKKMEVDKPSPILPPRRLPPVKKLPLKKKVMPAEMSQSVGPPVRLVIREELRQLVTRAWHGTEERLKALEMRDRLIRTCLPARQGAIKGCCPDMCPERERLVREFQRQVAGYEMDPIEQRLDPKRAVKQYSRSSADQEEPLSHDLRPVPVLKDTLFYLLHHVIDLCDDPQTSLEDWFHFLWDRFRAIRKDITQQALCCQGSVSLVEACARFHAHCAARLVEEPPSTFDQRLNTENLSKCLQSLKYMYNDLRARGQPEGCKREAEFRAYVVLLNMHDSNFMWEVQQLAPEVQCSPEIHFAIKVYTALDNNNYIRFFKLVKETTYLNACILLRYFNDVRARALTRMIKSYSPRGVSQFPANELMDMLAFESINSMELFLEHYGLQMATGQDYSFVLLDKNAFEDNSSTYAPERAVNLIESKLNTSLAEVVYGDVLPPSKFESYVPHCSFETTGFIKKSAILAEDQGYIAPKDKALEILHLMQNTAVPPKIPETSNSIMPAKIPPSVLPNRQSSDFTFAKPEIPKGVFSQNVFNTNSSESAKKSSGQDGNLFKKASGDTENNLFKKQPSSNVFSNAENKFIFSKPEETSPPKYLWQNKQSANSVFSKESLETSSFTKPVFGGQSEPLSGPSTFFNPASKPPMGSDIFGGTQKKSVFDSNQLHGEITGSSSINAPGKPLFSTPTNIFQSAATSLFGSAAANIAQIDKNKAIEEEKKLLALEVARKKREEEERRAQEIRKQEELKRKIEEEKKILEIAKRKAELEKQRIELEKQKAEYEQREKEKKKKELEIRIEKQLQVIIPEVTNEVVHELCTDIIEEELQRLKGFINMANNVSEDLIKEICEEECKLGIQAAVRLNEIRVRIISRSVGRQWRAQVARSNRRRFLLHITPAWLPSRPPPTPQPSQAHAIQRMKDFHRGKLPNFRMPAFKHHTINLFETIKKSLLKRSQDLKQKSFSLNVYWKLVLSIPDESESKKCSSFYDNWFKELFADNQIEPTNHQVYLSENHWYKKFAVSISKIRGKTIQKTDPKILDAMSGLNGLVFYCNTNFEPITNLLSRINATLISKCEFECIPVGIVLITHRNTDKPLIESHMNDYRNKGMITEFKMFLPVKFDSENLSASSKEAFKWLAKGLMKSPSIESNLLSTYLNHCIGNELWYRFKLSLNSSYQTAFNNTKILTDLYNEAVSKTTEMVCNPDLHKYPVSPSEFKEFISFTHTYPKEYQHISSTWKSNMAPLRNIISSFKIPQYSGEWPPLSFGDFQDTFRNFINKLNWFSNSEEVALRIFSIIKDDDSDESSFDDEKYSWIEIMNILVEEKIVRTVESLRENSAESSYKPDTYSNDFTVVYRQRDLNNYRTTPWWYRSQFTKDVCPLVEDFPDDMSELDEISTKRRKLDLSIDSEMPDDAWISTVLTDIEETMKQTSQCHEILTEFEKSIEIETQKQIEFRNLLQAAIRDG